jgi:hypothetical protein
MRKNDKRKEILKNQSKKISVNPKKTYNDPKLQMGFCKEFVSATCEVHIPENEQRISEQQMRMFNIYG